ncbi:pilus assembly protein TadG-related protein [Paenibacillus hexagrammi]|uniref:Pilus assembly protein TadG-related protein n=1 Tax=Paenibacillus hexagrammi TaxID=2908839 RepID=A0ABY3SG75_9BACL|nr:pilus assembly protein TadG-related protein [Paenibacillus sp. YPD9-1]UJF32837.1 pilus assembly protein TadG-related protein [Paenibacillus sp. YPD9-1]
MKMERGSRYIHGLWREEQGSSIVLIGLMLMGLLAACALIIDGGTLFAERSHLQKAANAAALSGAQELTGQSQTVTAIVQKILQEHQEAGSLKSTGIELGKSIRVSLAKPVPLHFAKLLGWDEVTVEAEAAAQILPMGSGTGVAPLGIDDSIALEYGKAYKLKVDQTQSVSGVFGILALGGNGANTYEYNLMHGYSNEVDIGDIIDTQTGNIAGNTRDAVQYRINADPYPPADLSHRDSPRILLVPTYKPYNFTTNQMKQIQVTGFAYFYITDPMSSKDTAISGIFIKRTGKGTAKPGAIDKGAYAIRLIE